MLMYLWDPPPKRFGGNASNLLKLNWILALINIEDSWNMFCKSESYYSFYLLKHLIWKSSGNSISGYLGRCSILPQKTSKLKNSKCVLHNRFFTSFPNSIQGRKHSFTNRNNASLESGNICCAFTNGTRNTRSWWILIGCYIWSFS